MKLTWLFLAFVVLAPSFSFGGGPQKRSADDEFLTMALWSGQPLSVAKGELDGFIQTTIGKDWFSPDSPQAVREVKIVEIADVPETFVVFFRDQYVMNLALRRASEFIKNKKMMNHGELLEDAKVNKVDGHLLKGGDLWRYWQAFEASQPSFPRPSDPNDRMLLEIEKGFWDRFVLPTIRPSDTVTIIAIAMNSKDENILRSLLEARGVKIPEADGK